ncbi:MAG: hypothetical protein ACK40M_07760 [Flavobacteriales bacterium]
MLLTDKEFNEFGIVLKNCSRNTLFRLWKAEGLNRKTEASEVYSKVFGEPYSLKKDARLRHERRLLRDKLKEFLSARYLKRSGEIHEHNRDILYLEELLSRKEWSTFLNEVKSVRKKLEIRHDQDGLIRVIRMELSVYVNQGKTDKENIQTIAELNKQLLSLEQLVFDRKKAQAESVHVWCNRWMGESNTESLAQKIIASISKEEEDKVVRYFRLKTESIRAVSDRRMEQLEEMRSLAENIDDFQFPRSKELAVILSNLALEYSFRQQFDHSVAHFRESLKYRKSIPEVNVHQIVYNLIGVLLRCEKITDALELIETEGHALQRDPFLFSRFGLLKGMALILNGNWQDALVLHREQSGKLSEQDDLYHRVQELIILVMRNKRETAERYIRNLRDLLRGRSDVEHYKVFLKVLATFFKLENEPISEKDALIRTIDPAVYSRGNVLPLIWLRKWIAHNTKPSAGTGRGNA